jgi:hypothetical protein
MEKWMSAHSGTSIMCAEGEVFPHLGESSSCGQASEELGAAPDSELPIDRFDVLMAGISTDAERVSNLGGGLPIEEAADRLSFPRTERETRDEFLGRPQAMAGPQGPRAVVEQTDQLHFVG